MTVIATNTTASPEIKARWMDFAVRMARHGWPSMTDKRRARLIEEVETFIANHDPRLDDPYDSWDQGPGFPLCDAVSEAFEKYEKWDRDGNEVGRFYCCLRCCLRAGIDMATETGPGVMGFDVGLLRRMYDGEIPAWIAVGYTPPLTDAVPDDMPIWL